MIRFLFIFFVLFQNYIIAQSGFNANDFLRSSFDDIYVKNQSKIVEATKALKFHQPWLKSINARIGITGSALGDTIYGYIRNEDNYGLFIEPNSILETRWQKRVKSSKIELYQAEQNQFLEDAIHTRYQVIIDYYWTNVWQNFIHERDSLNNQKIYWIQEGIALAQKLDIDDVLRADREKSDLELKKEKFKLQELDNKLEISSLSNNNNIAKPSLDEFIGVENIKDYSNSTNTNSIQVLTHEEKLSESKINYLNTKASYINSQNRKVFNDLRISYDDPLYLTRPNKFNTFNNISFRIGLSVPLPANNRFRKAEAQIDILEEKLNLEKQKMNRINSFDNLNKELNSYLIEYGNFTQLIDESMVSKLMNNPQTRNLISPVEWIDLQLRMNEYKEKKLKLEEQIFRKYFQLLKTQGVLAQSPYKNYLLKNQSVWSQ